MNFTDQEKLNIYNLSKRTGRPIWSIEADFEDKKTPCDKCGVLKGNYRGSWHVVHFKESLPPLKNGVCANCYEQN